MEQVHTGKGTRFALAIAAPLLLVAGGNAPVWQGPAETVVPPTVADGEPDDGDDDDYYYMMMAILRMYIEAMCIILECDEVDNIQQLIAASGDADDTYARMEAQIAVYYAQGVQPGLTDSQVQQGIQDAQDCLDHLDQNPDLVPQPLRGDYETMLQLVKQDLLAYRPSGQ